MGRTRPEKLWLSGAALGALLVAVIGYFFLISPQRASTTSTRDDVSSAQLQATTLQGRIMALTTQNAKLARYQAALTAAQTALPAASDLNATPNLLRSLAALAAATSTSLGSINVGEPTAVAAPAAAPAASASAGSSGSSNAPAATAPAASAVSSVDVQTTVSGSQAGLTAFLTRLQSGHGRAVLVTNVTLAQRADVAGSARGGGSTLTLDMTAFVRSS